MCTGLVWIVPRISEMKQMKLLKLYFGNATTTVTTVLTLTLLCWIYHFAGHVTFKRCDVPDLTGKGWEQNHRGYLYEVGKGLLRINSSTYQAYTE